MAVPGGAFSEMILKRGVRATSKIMFIFLVILLHCEIAAVVVSSAATSMLPNLSSFGNNIAKAYRNNHTDEVPINQRKSGELSHASTVVSDVKLNVDQINRQPSILLDESKRRIWCFGPHADSKVKNQRYYLPVRFLSVLRKKDVIILPGNHAPTREFVDFMIPLLGLSEDQIIWTSGESISIDADIDANIRNRIKDLIETSGTSTTVDSDWVLVPYCVTKGFLGWSSELCTKFSAATASYSDSSGLPTNSGRSTVGSKQTVNSDFEGGGATLEIFGESESWNAKYGHKGILHRHMSDLSISSVMDDIDQGTTPTLVAKGYQCSTVDHLLKAYELLKTQTLDNRAVIKPISGCAGWGILFIDSAEELMKYDFPMGEVLLEEMLNLDMTEDGLVISPAVHYLGPQLFGGQLVDQLMKNTSYLGWRESKADPVFQQKVLDMTEKLLKFTQPRGPGGYDFLSVNGEPVLSDVNTGRFNGAHQPKLFLSQYAPVGSMWYCWKHKPSKHVNVSDVWDAFVDADLAFSPLSDSGSREGVFPLTYLRGVDGIFIAVANTTDRAFDIYQRAAGILGQLEGTSVTS